MKNSLWVIMPVYNEAECIEKVIKDWMSELQRYDFDLTFCVLNDGSKDNTLEILKKLEQQEPGLKVIDKKNSGHGATCVMGYQLATRNNADWVFQTDSDDQFFPEDFKLLWDKREHSDFVLGFRQIRHDAPFRLFVTRILRASLYILFGAYVKDSNIPFRLIKGSFLKKMLEQLPDPSPFAPNVFLSLMAKKAGQEIYNIPVKHKERETGTVSIVRIGLIKVCVKSLNQLFSFRKNFGKKIKAIKA
jgi:dolichol-phosphate mannosyltransferase